MSKLLRFICLLLPFSCLAAGSAIPLDKAKVDLSDYASLQRGSQIYANYCGSCHSLRYVRYSDLAKGIKITDESGEVLADLVKQNLMFVGDKITDPMVTSLQDEQSIAWFGTNPPDLSLTAKSRGADWLYTYLRTFYKDESKPWGINNKIFPDVGMPHVLVNLQGLQTAKMVDDEIQGLDIEIPGKLDGKSYDRLVLDLVNFLSYVAEPNQLERKRIGGWVLMFLGIFIVFTYLLKREYWKDIE